MYRQNRYYDPTTGRFTQSDPIGVAGGMNRYGYAHNDPINYSDPIGFDEEESGGCPPGTHQASPQEGAALYNAAIDLGPSVTYQLGAGGNSSLEGTDCSGFVMLSEHAAGLDIPYTTSGGFSTSPYYLPVTGTPQIGDIMQTPGHVTIFSGGNNSPLRPNLPSGFGIGSPKGARELPYGPGGVYPTPNYFRMCVPNDGGAKPAAKKR